MCEEHSEKICLMPDHLFSNLITSLEQGLKEYLFMELTCVINSWSVVMACSMLGGGMLAIN